MPEPVTAITADVSFIGLKLALPPALALAAPGAWLVALVKPQFEVGRACGRQGRHRARRCDARWPPWPSIEEFVAAQSGWTVLGQIESPIEGGDGNIEFLLAAQKS